MKLADKIRALKPYQNASTQFAGGYFDARREAESIATAHDALMQQMLDALSEFVGCREEARCIDDCVPDASRRAWKALGERIQKTEDAARDALRAYREQQ